jgi:hypothetical protein
MRCWGIESWRVNPDAHPIEYNGGSENARICDARAGGTPGDGESWMFALGIVRVNDWNSLAQVGTHQVSFWAVTRWTAEALARAHAYRGCDLAECDM